MFEYIIIGFIIISSINLMLDNPLQDPKGILPKIIKYTDLVVTIIFTIEAILKIIA